MELLPLAFTSGWTSGINAYATVLILGLLGRFAGIEEIPAGLQRTDVLIAAAALTLIEFVADKVPYVDSIWDVASTVVRPIAGAVIGALLAGNSGDLVTLTLAAVGGVTALVSHLVKAGLRLAINSSPEPASNIGASLAGESPSLESPPSRCSTRCWPRCWSPCCWSLGSGSPSRYGTVRRGWHAFRRWMQPA